jgi:hypothetical protein
LWKQQRAVVRGKSKKAAAPDPAQQALAYAQAENMRRQTDMSEKQYAEMMELAREQQARGDEQFNWYRGLQDEAMDRSRRLDDRYWDTTAKQEDAFYDMVNKYDTSAERDRMAGAAMADVEGAAEIGRGAIGREAAARGLNLGSPAALGMFMDQGLDTSLAKAAAATASQAAARERGFSLRAQAAGLAGTGQQAGSANYMNAASGAGGDALNAGSTGLRAASSAWNGLNQGMGTAIGWGNSAGNTFGNINSYNLQRAQSGGSPFGKILGGLAGSFLGPLGTAAGSAVAAKWSDRRLKTDITPVGKLDNGLTVYSYRYKAGGPTQIGVMADEVAVKAPHAYVKGGAGNGYDAVDYAAL